MSDAMHVGGGVIAGGVYKYACVTMRRRRSFLLLVSERARIRESYRRLGFIGIGMRNARSGKLVQALC